MDQTRDAARRQFLKRGGLGLAGAAFLAACAKHVSPVAQSGTTVPPDSSTTAPQPPPLDRTPTDIDNDRVQLRTATSIELLTVDVYRQVQLYLSSTAAPLAQRFAVQHQTHARELQTLTERAFGLSAAVDQPNSTLNDGYVKPAMAQLVSDATTAGSDATAQRAAETAFVRFLADLETTGAATYVTALGILSLPTFRQPMGNLMALSARRATALDDLIGEPLGITSVYPVTGAAPIEALVK